MLASTAAFRRWRREDQKPKVSLGYTRGLRSAWHTGELVKLIRVIRISIALRHMPEVPALRRSSSRPAQATEEDSVSNPIISPAKERKVKE